MEVEGVVYMLAGIQTETVMLQEVLARFQWLGRMLEGCFELEKEVRFLVLEGLAVEWRVNE